MKAIIGIAGLAGDGKDSVCKILENYFSHRTKSLFCRVSLADALKKDCLSACSELYGINPVRCSREQKEKIRDLLVFYGKVMRNKTSGKHWTQQAEKTIKQITHREKNSIFCVPDIRYAQFENDEVQWLKSFKNSHLIYIKKYTTHPNPFSELDINKQIKKYSTPVNSQEAFHSPLVEKLADYVIEWHDCSPDKPEQDDNCVKAVNYVAKKIFDSFNASE